MDLPEFADFPSRPTSCGRGRLYDVCGTVRLVAYRIDDRESLAAAGAREGFFVYACLDRRRVGHWSWGRTAAQLEVAMRTYRLAFNRINPRPTK